MGYMTQMSLQGNITNETVVGENCTIVNVKAKPIKYNRKPMKL